MDSLVLQLPRWFRAVICLTACLATLVTGAPMATFCCLALCTNSQEVEAAIFEDSKHCEQSEVRDCCRQAVPARYSIGSPSDSCCHQGEQQKRDSQAMLRFADAPTLAGPESKQQVLRSPHRIQIDLAPIRTQPLEKSDTYLRCCVFLI